MNRLEICKMVAIRCGISGVRQFASTINQSGDFLSVVTWVDDAWNDLQIKRPDWGWMRDDFAFQSVIGKSDYTPSDAGITSYGRWHQDTLRAYRSDLGVADDSFMYPLDWPSFRNRYLFGVQAAGKPRDLAVGSSGALHIGPVPDAIYTVYGEYQCSATALTLDGDVPALPADYHMMIVHGARMKYAADENAAEVMAEASADYGRMLLSLVNAQTEEISLGLPLA